MATQPCIGFPADTLGSDGDAASDLKNRITYFPKANGTWAKATAYALQGPVGPGLLTGSGAPANTVGSPGQGYADLSSSGFTYVKNAQNIWAQTGQIIGAQGLPGPSGQSVPSLTSQSYTYGPMAANATALALSGTPQAIPFVGGTQAYQFTASPNTTLAGAVFVLSSANTPGATTFTLRDLTAGTSVYSYTIGTAGTVVTPTANAALTSGNTHQWQVSGSGNAFVQATPIFLQPASVGVANTYAPLFGQVFPTAPTSPTNFVASQASGVTYYMGLTKTGFLYSAQFLNTMGSAATVGLYNSGGTLVYSASVPANTTTPFVVGPLPVNQVVLAAGYYTWRVTSSSTGYVSVLTQLCL